MDINPKNDKTTKQTLIKVLLIDYNSVKKNEAEKCRHLSSIPDLDLTLLIPPYIIENYRRINSPDSIPFCKLIIAKSIGRIPHRAFFITGLIKALRNKPDIIHILCDEPFLWTFQSLLYKMVFSPKSKFIFHSWQNIKFDRKNYSQKNYFLYWIDSLTENFVFRYSDAAVVRNREAEDVLRIRGFKKTIRYIPWGVDTGYYKKNNRHSKNTKPVIGYIGRFVREKGIKDIIKAVSLLKTEYLLLLIGNGPELQAIKDEVKSAGIDSNVEIVSDATYDKIPSYLNSMDILVLPSRSIPKWKEQFGRVLVEAMACEVPVIGSSYGAIPEVIRDCGLIFREGDINELAEKISILLKNPDMRKRLGQEGRSRAIEHFSWQSFAKNTYNLFKEVLGI